MHKGRFGWISQHVFQLSSNINYLPSFLAKPQGRVNACPPSLIHLFDTKEEKERRHYSGSFMLVLKRSSKKSHPIWFHARWDKLHVTWLDQLGHPCEDCTKRQLIHLWRQRRLQFEETQFDPRREHD